jgi:hypothetical protein
VADASNDQSGSDKPGSQGANAAVASAGEPSESLDTRTLTAAAAEEGVSPEELDAREERFTGPRKPMGPSRRAVDVPETSPEGLRPGRGPNRAG